MHGAAAILFTAGILARLKGPVLWCLASRDLYAPALARADLHSDWVIYAETWRDAEVMPVMEEGVRCPGLAGVVGEIGRLSLTASRRLQLAAEATGVVALVLRRWAGGATSGHGWGAGSGNAAATRWRVTALPSAPLPTPGLGQSRWQVEPNWLELICPLPSLISESSPGRTTGGCMTVVDREVASRILAFHRSDGPPLTLYLFPHVPVADVESAPDVSAHRATVFNPSLPPSLSVKRSASS